MYNKEKETKRAEGEEEALNKKDKYYYYYELTMDIIARALSKLFFMGDTLGTARRGKRVGLG